MNILKSNPGAIGGSITNEAFKTFTFKVGSLTVSPNYIEAALIVLLIFMLVFTMARMHRLFIDWSFKGAAMGVLVGFVLALVVEGFFIVGGSTILTRTLGWKNAPKPVQDAIDSGRAQFIKVLGASTSDSANCKP